MNEQQDEDEQVEQVEQVVFHSACMDETIKEVREGVRPYLVQGRPEWDEAEEWLADVAGHLVRESRGSRRFACGTSASEELIEQVNRTTCRLLCCAVITVAHEYGFTGDMVRDLAQQHGLGDLP